MMKSYLEVSTRVWLNSQLLWGFKVSMAWKKSHYQLFSSQFPASRFHHRIEIATSLLTIPSPLILVLSLFHIFHIDYFDNVTLQASIPPSLCLSSSLPNSHQKRIKTQCESQQQKTEINQSWRKREFFSPKIHHSNFLLTI